MEGILLWKYIKRICNTFFCVSFAKEYYAELGKDGWFLVESLTSTTSNLHFELSIFQVTLLNLEIPGFTWKIYPKMLNSKYTGRLVIILDKFLLIWCTFITLHTDWFYCKRFRALLFQNDILRMYCIDPQALVFMFNGGSSCTFTIHSVVTRICTNHYPLKCSEVCFEVQRSAYFAALGLHCRRTWVSMQYILNSFY